ncbi:hypothetical protein COOONC_28254, partial [Cooperia oncophora]
LPFFSYFQNILSNVDTGAVEVELLVDGSYRTVKTECVDVDSDDASTIDEKPSASVAASGSGTGTASSKAKAVNDDDIIVLSDSDDDEQQAVERAIRASIVDSNTVHSTSNPPLSPTPRSRDSSIIILDDDSPPRPSAPPPSNREMSFNVRLQTCNNSSSPITVLSSSSPTCAFSAPTSTMTMANGGNGVMPGRVPTIQTHSVLAGHQSIYNNSGALSYYHQSQWSQPAASRPQYPPPPTGTLNAGASFTAAYKQSLTAAYKQSLGSLIGRYQATNNPTGLSFNYATATAPPPPPQQQPTFPAGSNLQQVLASLVQQNQFTNGSGGNAPLTQ